MVVSLSEREGYAPNYSFNSGSIVVVDVNTIINQGWALARVVFGDSERVLARRRFLIAASALLRSVAAVTAETTTRASATTKKKRRRPGV